jgi:hypothetical protein
MRKIAIFIVLVSISCFGVFASDFSVNLNVNYGYGLSDFFDQSQVILSASGKNFMESRKNYMGFGFNISVAVPIIKHLTVVPGFTLKYGYQDYKYKELPDATDGVDDKSTYFFHISSGELNAVYDVICFKSDWCLSLVLGLIYNHFKADSGMMEEEKKFWGVHAGFGVKFLQLKHFGFQLFSVVEMPLESGLISYLNSYAGIFYRF